MENLNFEQIKIVQKVARSLYSNDAGFRAASKTDVGPMLEKAGVELQNPNTKVRVYCDSADTMYVTIPAMISSSSMPDQDLSGITGAGGGSSTASTSSTLPSCLGTASSASSLKVSAGAILDLPSSVNPDNPRVLLADVE